MLSPRLDLRALVALLRGLSAWRACAAVLCGLLVLPEHPASPLLTIAFAPVGIALWYLALARLERLVTGVTVPEVARVAHVAAGLGAVWVAVLCPPVAWLFGWAAVGAVAYAAAGEVARRRVRARTL